MVNSNFFSIIKYEKLIPTLACLFPILTLSHGKGYKLIPIFLLLAALPLLFIRDRVKLESHSKWLIIAFVCYFLSFLITILFHSDSTSKLDGPSRFLLCIPIFLAVLRYPPSFSWLSKSLITSSYIAGISAFVLYFIYEQDRAFRSENDFFSNGFMPIQSGDIAMTFGVICLPIAIYYLKKSALLATVVCSFGMAFGIAASYLSGTRGGWVCLPVAIAYLLYVHRHSMFKSTKKLINLAVLILPSLLIFWAINLSPQFQQNLSRIQVINTDIGKYSENETDSSVGIRVELWKDSIYTFMDYPLFGAGYDKRTEITSKRIEDSVINLPKRFLGTHSHNQYLEALSVQGLLGFFALMGVFLMPLTICRRLYRVDNEEVKTIAQCAALSIIMMMGYCLTQAIFRHNSGAIFYPLMTVILLASGLRFAEKNVV